MASGLLIGLVTQLILVWHNAPIIGAERLILACTPAGAGLLIGLTWPAADRPRPIRTLRPRLLPPAVQQTWPTSTGTRARSLATERGITRQYPGAASADKRR